MKITVKQYSRTLFDLTENKSQEEILIIVKKFAEILKENGQLKNTEKIMEKFGELYNEAHGIILAEIVSREKLSDELVEKLKSYIKDKYTAKVVEIENIVDAKIKGGIIIRVGDEIIDGSVEKQLINLKKVLYS